MQTASPSRRTMLRGQNVSFHFEIFLNSIQKQHWMYHADPPRCALSGLHAWMREIVGGGLSPSEARRECRATRGAARRAAQGEAEQNGETGPLARQGRHRRRRSASKPPLLSTVYSGLVPDDVAPSQPFTDEVGADYALSHWPADHLM